MSQQDPKKKFESAFKWTHYVFGNNMIAGVIQTFTLIFVVCLAFALFSAYLQGKL